MSLLQSNYNQAIIDSDLAIEQFPLQGAFIIIKEYPNTIKKTI